MTWKTLASIVVTLATALSDVSHAADRIVAPAVPDGLAAPAGYTPSRVAHAVGTQNYIIQRVHRVGGANRPPPSARRRQSRVRRS
jgi:hypothetical protein